MKRVTPIPEGKSTQPRNGADIRANSTHSCPNQVSIAVKLEET